MTELKHTNNGRESVPHPPEKEGGVLRIHNQIGAVVAAIIIASFAAFAGSASAQQPEYVIRSTYNNPLPWDDVQRRLNAMFSAVLNYCGGGSLDECLSALHYLNEASQDLERTWIMASVGYFDYDRTAPLGTYGVGLCTDLVTGEDRAIDAVPEGRRWHAWSSGTLCWDRNDDGDFDDAGEIGSLLMDE